MKIYDDLYPTPWECLIESLRERHLVPLLNQQGIHIEYTARRIKRPGSYEFDIMAANNEEVVLLTVRTKLKVNDVKDFLDDLRKISAHDSYHDRAIYGAAACSKATQKAVVYAEKHGLFVIRSTDDSASILNQEDFKPKVFT